MVFVLCAVRVGDVGCVAIVPTNMGIIRVDSDCGVEIVIVAVSNVRVETVASVVVESALENIEVVSLVVVLGAVAMVIGGVGVVWVTMAQLV